MSSCDFLMGIARGYFFRALFTHLLLRRVLRRAPPLIPTLPLSRYSEARRHAPSLKLLGTSPSNSGYKNAE